MCTCSLYFNLFSSLILLFFICFSPFLFVCFVSRYCSFFLNLFFAFDVVLYSCYVFFNDVSCLLFLVLSLELAFHCSSSCSLFLLLLFVLVLCVCDCCCSLFFVRDLAAEASFCFILATAQDFPHPSDQSIIPC